MNITDAFDSYLNAKVRVGEWKRDFDQRFYGPLGEALIGMAMQGAKNPAVFDQEKLDSRLSPQAKQKFRGE